MKTQKSPWPFLGIMIAVLAAMLAFVATSHSAPPPRNDNNLARDTSLVPQAEIDLTKVTVFPAGVATVDLSTLNFTPLILLVYADGTFYEGSDAPVEANDIPRAGSVIHSIAVNGRTSWQFRPASSGGATEIRIKVLGSN